MWRCFFDFCDVKFGEFGWVGGVGCGVGIIEFGELFVWFYDDGKVVVVNFGYVWFDDILYCYGGNCCIDCVVVVLENFYCSVG